VPLQRCRYRGAGYGGGVAIALWKLSRMRFALAIMCSLTAIAPSVSAQSSEVFEVALVRPSGPNSVLRSDLDGSQFVASRHTLAMLIASSYPELPAWRMSGGPSWVTTDLWDFVARLPPGMPAEQERLYRRTEQMLRTFLAEEFKLKTHFEQKEQPVYELMPAKGGVRLKPSAAATSGYRFTPGGIEFQHETMQELAAFLYCPNCPRQTADRPVFDRTGLTGFYDFTLNWSPSNSQRDAADAGPSIFTAVEEQLGLKLQPQRAQIGFLVIDHAEKPPQN
jgi:bla regulator protein BlaR1